MPNLLEHYIKEIISEEPYEVDWTKEFPDRAFIRYTVTANCCGDVREYTSVVTDKEWEQIKQQGYFWG